MRAAQITLTIVEIALFVAALAFYLIKLATSLRKSSVTLTEVSAGVKAVETHCAPVGWIVPKVNGQLRTVSRALGTLADLAEAVTSGEPAPEAPAAPQRRAPTRRPPATTARPPATTAKAGPVSMRRRPPTSST